MDSSRHLATPDGPSASRQRGFPGITAGGLLISGCRGPACHGGRRRAPRALQGPVTGPRPPVFTAGPEVALRPLRPRSLSAPVKDEWRAPSCPGLRGLARGGARPRQALAPRGAPNTSGRVSASGYSSQRFCHINCHLCYRRFLGSRLRLPGSWAQTARGWPGFRRPLVWGAGGRGIQKQEPVSPGTGGQAMCVTAPPRSRLCRTP